MFPIRVKTVQESDLRMLGSLARNIQRVLPVTQADIDAAAALGKGWVVWKVFEVSDPLDNMRGGTQLIIRQNSVQPGQNVRRVIFVSGPGGQTVIIRGTDYIVLPDAIANSLSYVKAFGGTEQRNLPDNYIQRQFIYMMDGSYLLTDIVPTYDGRVEMDFQTTTLPSGAAYFLGGRTETYGGLFFAKTSTGVFMADAFGNTAGSRYTSSVSTQNNTRYKFTYNNQVTTLESGGATLFTNTSTGALANGAALCINGFNHNGTVTASGVGIYLYSFKVWNAQGELVIDLVPAVQKGTVPVVGFYDTVSGTFKTATTGTFAAGGEAVPTPDVPLDIVTNNGVLRIQGSATGTVTQTGTPTPTTPVEPEFYQNHGLLLRAVGTDADTYDASTQTITREIGYHIFDGTETFGSSSAYGAAVYTSSAAALWGADKTKEVLCTHFAGQGPASSGTQPLYSCFFNASGHFYFRTTETAANFKAWLAELYANGTPLIVWFVNSAPETESFTPSVYADGTVETINAHSKNLWNPDVDSYEEFYVTTGTQYERYGHIYRNGTYTISRSSNSGNWIIYAKLVHNGVYGTALIAAPGQTRTLTATGDDQILVYASSTSPADTTEYEVQVEKGSTATTYEPYYDGGTATTETLLKVGDYQDVQSIIDGVVTRNVGVKMLDGTEDGWTKTNNSFANSTLFADKKIEKSTLVCSHFQYNTGTTSTIPDGCVGAASAAKTVYFRNNALSTVGDWEQWLADQCNAGTPVIVVYPLADPTTESVAGQTLQVTDGDNVLEITQASLDGLELEVEYQAAVALTIQEVQDANLDNNVEVTIQ